MHDNIDQLYISARMLQLAGELKRKKEEAKLAKEAYEKAQKEADETEKELSQIMEEAGVKSFTIEGTKYTVTQRVYISPLAEAKEEVFDALVAEGYGDLVKRTVSTNSFCSFVLKDLLGGDIDKIVKEAERTCYEIADLSPQSKVKAAIEMMLPAWLKGKCNVYSEHKISMRKDG